MPFDRAELMSIAAIGIPLLVLGLVLASSIFRRTRRRLFKAEKPVQLSEDFERTDDDR